MWDVGGDQFDSLAGIGILEVADLSLDEPELQGVLFSVTNDEQVSVDENDIEQDEEAA